jgi:hypothetical protein
MKTEHRYNDRRKQKQREENIIANKQIKKYENSDFIAIEDKEIVYRYKKIGLQNDKGENNWFMNSVFQLFFNVKGLCCNLAAIDSIEKKDDIACQLNILFNNYLQKDKNQSLGATENITTDHEKDTFVDIKEFREALSKIYPSFNKMEKGDVTVFFVILIQVVNSILLTGESNKINTVSNPDNWSIIYNNIGIKFIESKNSDDYAVTPHYKTYIHLDVKKLVKKVQDIRNKDKGKESMEHTIIEYNFFKYWKNFGEFRDKERKDLEFILENDPKLFTFHFYMGDLIKDEFSKDHIDWFVKLLPLRISQKDIFDKYKNDSIEDNFSFEDDFSDNECEKVLENKVYILRAIILYEQNHYITWIFDDLNWVIYDDKKIHAKCSFEGISEYMLSSNWIPLIIIYEFDENESKEFNLVIQKYCKFKEQVDSNAQTKDIKNKIETKSYWRQDIIDMNNWLSLLNKSRQLETI